MSFSSWSYTDTLTVWPVTRDEYGQETRGAPYQLAGSWASGGDLQRGADGREFVPTSSYWFEVAATMPSVGDMILPGALAGAPPSNAEKVRKVATWHEWAGDVRDVAVYT